MQLNLFEQTTAPPKDPPKPQEPPRYRVPLDRHEVKSPWGTPDKKGNLFWEKMHKELEKLPPHFREFFNYITQGAQPEHLDGLEKALRMFNKATEFDRIDFDESRGRL